MAFLDIRNLNIVAKENGRKIPIITNLDLSVNKGEILALIGASGSGKSLIAQAILQLRRDGMEFNVDRYVLETEKFKRSWTDIDFRKSKSERNQNQKSIDLTTLTRRGKRQTIGKNISLITQEPRSCLDPSLTIKKQLMEVIPKERWYDIFNFDKKRKARDLRKWFGKDAEDRKKILSSFPGELTEDQCHQVMIAIALASEPELIVADEPLANLDITTRLNLLTLLQGINQNEGKSILIICSDLASIINFATRFAIIYAGQIVEIGTRDKILNNPSHPYTASLIKSVKEMSSAKPKVMISASTGKMPDYMDMPPGCRYGATCPRARTICNTMPELTQRKNYAFRCHMPLEDSQK